jgi:hypothetical protein
LPAWLDTLASPNQTIVDRLVIELSGYEQEKAVKAASLILGLVILMACLSACRTLPDQGVDVLPGISGQTRFDDQSVLLVHDIKAGRDGARISLLSTSATQAPVLRAVKVDDWADAAGPANDLEAVCPVVRRPNEFIVIEAGSWQGDYGRLFHLVVNEVDATARVLGSAQLPIGVDTNFSVTGDQYEGVACVANGDDTLLLILGERGGSEAYPTGVLRWADLDLRTHELTFSPEGMQGIQVDAPGNWNDSTTNRDISGLYLAPDLELWVSAAEELGEAGPFYSVIYSVGQVVPEQTQVIRLHPNPRVWREMAGFKIEALSAPSTAIPDSVMSFGTEDEVHAGTWRAVR